MKWFEGNIADAVSASKSTSAVFVVFVEGLDDMSKTMSSVLDSGGITADLSSSKFICIKLTKDSESHQQFTEIYKIVPVPALFFIGENGVPLEIVAGDNLAENVSKKILSAISKIKGETALSSHTTTPKENSPPPTTSTVPERQLSRESTPSSSTSSQEVPEVNHIPSAPPEDAVVVTANDDKDQAVEMERVQELIKKKREENQKLDEEKEKEKELARRCMGKEISLAKKSQQERELEEMRKEREKDRKLEAEARQRVLRQIEEDKANRAARNQTLQSSTSASNTNNSSSVSSNPTQKQPTLPKSQSNEARIQFKLPDGQTRTQTFPSNTTLRDLRTYIDANIALTFKEYTLATTFPRREFVNRDMDKDLMVLELFPSSVLLILPVQGNMTVMRGPGWTSAFVSMLWALVQPVLDIGSYLKSLITGSSRDSDAPSSSTVSDQEPSSSQQTPQLPYQPEDQTFQPNRQPYYNSLGGGKTVRKRGNVHSLSDGNDSNDENNTWNGNSTQLM